jgi:hypothetical protein
MKERYRGDMIRLCSSRGIKSENTPKLMKLNRNAIRRNNGERLAI